MKKSIAQFVLFTIAYCLTLLFSSIVFHMYTPFTNWIGTAIAHGVLGGIILLFHHDKHLFCRLRSNGKERLLTCVLLGVGVVNVSSQFMYIAGYGFTGNTAIPFFAERIIVCIVAILISSVGHTLVWQYLIAGKMIKIVPNRKFALAAIASGLLYAPALLIQGESNILVLLNGIIVYQLYNIIYFMTGSLQRIIMLKAINQCGTLLAYAILEGPQSKMMLAQTHPVNIGDFFLLLISGGLLIYCLTNPKKQQQLQLFSR